MKKAKLSKNDVRNERGSDAVGKADFAKQSAERTAIPFGKQSPPKIGRSAKPTLRSKVMKSLFPEPFRYSKIALSTVCSFFV